MGRGPPLPPRPSQLSVLQTRVVPRLPKSKGESPRHETVHLARLKSCVLFSACVLCYTIWNLISSFKFYWLLGSEFIEIVTFLAEENNDISVSGFWPYCLVEIIPPPDSCPVDTKSILSIHVPPKSRNYGSDVLT